jgi:hypothetical protein
MRDHADSAQSWFDRSVATTEPGAAAGIAQVGMRVAPSPARGWAQLRFALPQAGRARVDVLDVEGRVVRVLADCELARGTHTLDWDGRDEAGRSVAGGIYVCRLVTPAGTVNRKAVVLR